MTIKQFVATKAFIEKEGKVLILRESDDYDEGTNKGRFDVAGGRVEPGENYEESLRREVKEETGLEVDVGTPFAVDEWRPEVEEEQWQIIGIFFRCTTQGEVDLGEDHEEYVWMEPEDYQEYDLIPSLNDVFLQYLERCLW